MTCEPQPTAPTSGALEIDPLPAQRLDISANGTHRDVQGSSQRGHRGSVVTPQMGKQGIESFSLRHVVPTPAIQRLSQIGQKVSYSSVA